MMLNYKNVFLSAFILLQSGILVAQVAQNYEEKIAEGYDLGKIKGLEILPNALNFLVMGDFGRQGEYNQEKVALQMAKTMVGTRGDFIVSTGDNFYPIGVASTQDPAWQASFEQVYKYHSLHFPWYITLGNHDYAGNVNAQIEYSQISRRWNLPDRYYTFTKTLNGGKKALFVVLDTSPFEKPYYQNENMKAEIQAQDTLKQKKWLERVLSQADTTIAWKMVVGHHPLYSAGKRYGKTQDAENAFLPIFTKYGVDAYLCGHEHDLQHLKLTGKTHYFVSGAGSEKVNKFHPSDMVQFYKAENGFMSFSMDKDNILIQVIDGKGNVIYTTKITH
jgi:tartrate-resistant acid phosphatase type 5